MENAVLLSNLITLDELLYSFSKRIDHIRNTDPLLYQSLCKDSGLKYWDNDRLYRMTTQQQNDYIFQIVTNMNRHIVSSALVYKCKLTDLDWIRLTYSCTYESTGFDYFIDFNHVKKDFFTEFDGSLLRDFNDKIIIAQNAVIDLFDITKIFGSNFKKQFLKRIEKDCTI